MNSVETNELAPKVALLGAEAAYHDIAAKYLSPESGENEKIRCSSFPEILERLESGEADRAIIAIANSEIGILPDAYGVVISHDSYVVGEAYLRIIHNLLVLPEVESVDQIELVKSNPKALAQCNTFLGAELQHAGRLEGPDTATCAQEVADMGDPTRAAIASSQAAERYGLKILRAGIQTNPNNQTRFWMLERKPREDTGANKTSLVLATPNLPGSLVRAIGAWAAEGINLSKIREREMPHAVHSPWGAYYYATGQHELVERIREKGPRSAWGSHFDIDVDAGFQEPHMQKALAALAMQTGVEHRILGSYPKGELVE